MLSPHRLTDRNALCQHSFRLHLCRCFLTFLGCLQQRITILTLDSDDLRHLINKTAAQNILQFQHSPNEQNAISYKDDQIFRYPSQLFKYLINIGFCSIIEKVIIHMRNRRRFLLRLYGKYRHSDPGFRE